MQRRLVHNAYMHNRHIPSHPVHWQNVSGQLLGGGPEMHAALLRWAFPALNLRSLRHNVLVGRRKRGQ
jgi:hypothetical protein